MKSLTLPISYAQLLTPQMTPEVAAAIMGDPVFVAEQKLREAANARSRTQRLQEIADQIAASNFPTLEPCERNLVRLLGGA